MLRITSGILKGLNLVAPKGDQTRPSSDRLRQAVFNVLRNQNVLAQAAVADLFAGSGALGFEAISEGAQSVTFVESHRLALDALKRNQQQILESLQKQQLALPAITIIARDIDGAYPRLAPVDIIFLDPPYAHNADQDWFSHCIELENQHSKLKRGGYFIYEAGKNEAIATQFANHKSALILQDQKIYGDSQVLFFVKQ